VIKHSEVAILDDPKLSRYYRIISRRVPIVGGGNAFHLYPSRRGDVFYRLSIPTIPTSKARKRVTWGVYSDRWLYIGGDQRGNKLLEQLSPYLSYIGYKGVFGINWTRHRYSNFLIDAGSNVGYDEWIGWMGSSGRPVDTHLKELVAGWH
jgi:hypothetical protein